MAFTLSATARWLPHAGRAMKSTLSASRTKAHVAKVSSFDRSAVGWKAHLPAHPLAVGLPQFYGDSPVPVLRVGHVAASFKRFRRRLLITRRRSLVGVLSLRSMRTIARYSAPSRSTASDNGAPCRPSRFASMDIARCIALPPRRLRVFSASSARAGSQCSGRRGDAVPFDVNEPAASQPG